MELAAGTYTITSLAQNNNGTVGRSLVEDKSLNPKKVAVLPPNVPPGEWEIEAVGDHKYILRARGAGTTAIGNFIFAVLLPEPAPTKWFVKLNLHSRTSYNILDSEEPSIGWVFPQPGDEDASYQVEYGEVTGALNRNELWDIKRVVD